MKSGRNSDYQWNRFDSQAYVEQNYHTPRDDDRWITSQLGLFFRAQSPGIKALDVGTGPNLISPLAAVGRSEDVTVWEYSSANVNWLRSTIAAEALSDHWMVFWGDLVEAAPEVYSLLDPGDRLRQCVDVVQGNVFDLPTREWDTATMLFVAESLTSDLDEFFQACHAFASAVRPGGAVAAAFMEGSSGYATGSVEFPAVAVGMPEVAQAFDGFVNSITITRVPDVGERVRLGYQGMLLMTGEISH